MRPGSLLGVACLARALYPLDDSPDVVTRWDPLDCRNSTAPPCAFLAAARQCAQAPTQPCADERECPTAASRWLRGALHALHNGTARREKSFAPTNQTLRCAASCEPDLDLARPGALLEAARDTTLVIAGESVAHQIYNVLLCELLAAWELGGGGDGGDGAAAAAARRARLEADSLAWRARLERAAQAAWARAPSLKALTQAQAGGGFGRHGDDPGGVLFASVARFEQLNATVAFLDCKDSGTFIVRVPAALAALRATLARDGAGGARRVGLVVQVGYHFNDARREGRDLFADYLLFAARPEVRRLADARAGAREGAARWRARVLEVAPTHWRTELGLYERDEVGRGRGRPCAPLRDAGGARVAAPDGRGGDDAAESAANYRNRAIEAALNCSLPMLRVWRALAPAWRLHRSGKDCTHLGFDALVFASSVIHTFLRSSAEWAPRPASPERDGAACASTARWLEARRRADAAAPGNASSPPLPRGVT